VVKIGIVGGTGYTGVELLRLLAHHPQAEVCVITSRTEAGKDVSALFPSLRGFYDLKFSEPELTDLLACDIIFFATPHGVAQSMMKPLIDAGARVIDLSADFRIQDISVWEKWYGQTHACPELVETAVYGLPELLRDEIVNAQLVACPGCYPTSVLLGLKPLMQSGLVESKGIIASAASGVSGAGRQAKIDNLLSEASDSYKAYAVGGHRHLPEIEQGLHLMQAAQAEPAEVTFVPHLLPMIRGMHTTLYARLKEPEDLQALYESHYVNEPFVDVLPAGVFPQTRSVKGSNMCRLAIQEPQSRGMVVIMSVIDNLAKGASAQGVQNMNIMLGLDEQLGLNIPALMP